MQQAVDMYTGQSVAIKRECTHIAHSAVAVPVMRTELGLGNALGMMQEHLRKPTMCPLLRSDRPDAAAVRPQGCCQGVAGEKDATSVRHTVKGVASEAALSCVE